MIFTLQLEQAPVIWIWIICTVTRNFPTRISRRHSRVYDDFSGQPMWWNWRQRADFHENNLRISSWIKRNGTWMGYNFASSNTNMLEGWRLLQTIGMSWFSFALDLTGKLDECMCLLALSSSIRFYLIQFDYLFFSLGFLLCYSLIRIYFQDKFTQ